MTFELKPQFDSRASFYGKAKVSIKDNGDKVLVSYGTEVLVKSVNKEPILLEGWDCSQTTLRHVKEMLRQLGYRVGTKKDIEKVFGGNK